MTLAVFDELDRIPLFNEDPRPEGDSVLDGKPAAVIGATTAPWGTRYAQKEQRSRGAAGNPAERFDGQVGQVQGAAEHRTERI